MIGRANFLTINQIDALMQVKFLLLQREDLKIPRLDSARA